ncbi:protein S100-B isoform X2 [Alligator mississippiensis]|uniref:protein S100-B isoform X2 n=1 Tax=Alligator mississippiensis TaxID=8496 RepID=UPI0009076C01|nr:protein S100-B isoform X2 [Alligator mississippiensis]
MASPRQAARGAEAICFGQRPGRTGGSTAAGHGLPPAGEEIRDPNTLERLFKDLDADGDKSIDFQEYTTLVAMVTAACHTSFLQDQ